jgi:hypothetical protein
LRAANGSVGLGFEQGVYPARIEQRAQREHERSGLAEPDVAGEQRVDDAIELPGPRRSP